MNDKKHLMTINDRDVLISALRKQIEDEEKKVGEQSLQLKKRD